MISGVEKETSATSAPATASFGAVGKDALEVWKLGFHVLAVGADQG